MSAMRTWVLICVGSVMVANAGAATPPAAKPPILELRGMTLPSAEIRGRLAPYVNARASRAGDWAADGKTLYVTSTGHGTAQIHKLQAAMGALSQMTFLPGAVGHIRASRDPANHFVVFATDSGPGDTHQILFFDPSKDHAVLLTDGRSRQRGFELSADGSVLAYASAAPGSEDMDVYALNPKDPASRRLVVKGKGQLDVQSITPDGKKFLVLEARADGDALVHEVDATADKITLLTPARGDTRVRYGSPRYASGGKSILAISDVHGAGRKLVQLDAEGSETPLPTSGGEVDALEVSTDGETIAYVTNEQGASKLWIADAAGKSARAVTGVPVGSVDGLRFDAAGKRLAFNVSSAQIPTDVFVASVDSGAAERWIQSEIAGLDTAGWPVPSPVSISTFDQVDGKARALDAWLYVPKGSEKPAVVVLMPEAPMLQWRPSWNALATMLVRELGVAVLLPNLRGTRGRGKEFEGLDDGAKREDVFRDVSAVLDWIKTRPDLDAARVAVGGQLYGGYLALETAVREPDRVQAAFSWSGYPDLAAFVSSGKGPALEFAKREFGDPADAKVRGTLDALSPATGASKIKAPVLLISGGRDERVPLASVEALAAKLTEPSVLIARAEGHVFAYHPNLQLAHEAIAGFLAQKFLKKSEWSSPK